MINLIGGTCSPTASQNPLCLPSASHYPHILDIFQIQYIYMKHFNLTSVKELKKLLDKHGLNPKKSMGQYFLVSESFLQRIIQTANLNKQDIVIEVGPGLGTLTRKLAYHSKQVIAFEKDEELAPILKDILGSLNNVKTIYADALDIKIESYLPANKSYKMVSNLPFYAGKPIIQKFLEQSHPPKEMVLLLQKEVAETICAKPPKMSLLSVAVQLYAKPEYITTIPRGAFWPQPGVKSAVIKITTNPEQLKVNKSVFFKIVRAGFAHPRKQLINNLSAKFGLKKQDAEKWLNRASIDPSRRAQTLSVEEWVTLTQQLKIEN